MSDAPFVAPDAWSPRWRQRVLSQIPEPLVVGLEEEATFCMNSVVVDRTVIMPDCPARIGRQLEAWGFDVHVVPVPEFKKAGGAIRCLALDLDLLRS